ncbi:DUF1330 domain-containing protein [Motilibacter aurantiacus]|uniref:DUF1330 domain-containing protein n=1 Tax=Motilibacter aurantiacus TaxID=2714955 RepID=UPI00140CA422|nr:DUF1330 domain-containing protein [Motilibacter aurantiacus]NHC45551.1 DUF1330 domain-containing protein [Motilibacter aurantiacus]
MTAYCLFDNVEVTDPAGMTAYVDAVHATVRAHGGRYLVVGGTTVHVEGEAVVTYPVLIEFPSLGAAREWYASPEYAPLKALRQASSRANAVFFESAGSPLLEASAA